MKAIASISCFLLLVNACKRAPKLKEGRWMGTITLKSHPGLANPVAYDVRYKQSKLNIRLLGTDGTFITTQNPRLAGDTLLFSFNEPGEQLLLNCTFLKRNDTGYAGRCIDNTGKWAYFTMFPPVE